MRPKRRLEAGAGRRISIHAPVKGATGHDGPLFWFIHLISIHAPVKGATGQRRCRCHQDTAISIHAPVKGATRLSSQYDVRHHDFNPRTREGCDHGRHGDERHHQQHFNPRTREGCDHISMAGRNGRTHFNPRTREGCDRPRRGILFASFFISIHAPVKGATSITTSVVDMALYFNPRTREGCDVAVYSVCKTPE